MWIDFQEAKPKQNKTVVWAVKRHGGWEVISGRYRKGEKDEIHLADGMVLSLCLDYSKPHWVDTLTCDKAKGPNGV